MERVICGNITLFREICPNCDEYNLSGNSKFECSCGECYEGNTINSTRIVANKRRQPIPAAKRKELLGKQENKCGYCGIEFGTNIYRNCKIISLTIHADHIMPYTQTANNQLDNWILACNICNQWKSNKIFESIKECKKYLSYKWAKELSQRRMEIL